MHNLFANFVKILEVCKYLTKDLVNDKGNIPRPGVVPRFSDLEVIALSLTAESMELDSECYLFAKLEEYRDKMTNLISRRQYNDRRKFTAELCEKIRKRMVTKIDGGEDVFIIDSKPVRFVSSRDSTSLSARRERESKRFFAIHRPIQHHAELRKGLAGLLHKNHQ